MLRDQLRSIIANWIDEGLKANGWGNTKLGEVAKMSREQIWRLRTQQDDATDETLSALAHALRTPLPVLTIQDEQGKADYQMGVRDALRAVRTKLKEVETTLPTSDGDGAGRAQTADRAKKNLDVARAARKRPPQGHRGTG